MSLVSSQSASIARKCIIKQVTSSNLVRPYYTVANKYAGRLVPTMKNESIIIQNSFKNKLVKNNNNINSIFLQLPSFSFPSSVISLPTSVSYPREIVFLGGAPGSGKGTNNTLIAKLRNYNSPTIVVSDLLNTPECRLLKDNGIMVDDDFVFNTLLTELQKPIYKNGVVVDGFPRTATQVEYLKNFHNDQSLTSQAPQIFFVMLHVDEAASIARQQERGQQLIKENKKNASLGKATIEVRQTDVDIMASRARYELFKEQYSAVMSLGKLFPLVVVDAGDKIERVRENIISRMNSLPSSSPSFSLL